jgi:hypothetical protein
LKQVKEAKRLIRSEIENLYTRITESHGITEENPLRDEVHAQLDKLMKLLAEKQ